MIRKAFSIAVLFTIAASSLAQVDPDRVVMTINGEAVKGAEYYRRLEYLPGVGKLFGGAFAQLPPGLLTMEQIITEKLILALAKEKGLSPTAAEVDEAYKDRLANDPKFLTEWLGSGQNEAELRASIIQEVAQFKLVTAGIIVTDSQVEGFYNENKSSFFIPKRVKLRVIVVDSEQKAKEVDSDLTAGKPFPEVAAARSIDVSKNLNGEFKTVTYGDLNKEVRDAVMPLKAGQLTPWIPAGSNQLRFYVDEIYPESQIALTPAVAKNIRRKLMLDRGAIKNNLKKDMLDMRRKAQIDIKQKEFADSYRRFIETYLSGNN